MRRSWLLSCFLAQLFSFFGLVFANTETLVFKVPSDFKSESAAYYDITNPHLSLVNTNRASKEFEVPIRTEFSIELHGMEAGDTYMTKLCWTAADPVDVQTVRYGPIRKKGSNDLTYAVVIKLEPFSYPEIKTTTVPIIVSVAAMRLGLPVDLYSTLIYIALVLTATYCAYRHLRSSLW
ncbi:LAFA_0E09098g1_1 [Lachancea sp. 'fantastica']|nr:LAFA_0E09098g1_1 [Lachancea sp. 'fantastica']